MIFHAVEHLSNIQPIFTEAPQNILKRVLVITVSKTFKVLSSHLHTHVHTHTIHLSKTDDHNPLHIPSLIPQAFN